MGRHRISVCVCVAQENKENFKLRPQVKVTKLFPKYKQNPRAKKRKAKWQIGKHASLVGKNYETPQRKREREANLAMHRTYQEKKGVA